MGKRRISNIITGLQSGVEGRFMNRPYLQTGFTLVELMVGMVIGLMATLVIMQVFSVFEGQKRSTMGSSDAQTNGSIALYNITRDLQMAGWGLHPVSDPSDLTVSADAYSALRCATLVTEGAASDPWNLFPLVITDGGAAAGASDSVTIRYGDSTKGGIPARITAQAGAVATVDNSLGCRDPVASAAASQVPDTALLFEGTNCAMTRITALTNTTITLNYAALAATNVYLSCLGVWNTRAYSIVNNNLDLNGAANVADIINLQAQYGISNTVNDNQIVQWVDATGIWAAPTVADRNRIRAIRLAVIARNGLQEKTDVSTACSSTTLASPTGVCAWDATSTNPVIASPAPLVDLSNDPNWRRYRYRVFETIIPLRNLIWTRSTL